MTVGHWIRSERLKRVPPENSQAWVGAQMGVAQTTVSKWETEKSDVSREELRRLEEIFGSTYQAVKTTPHGLIVPLWLPVMGNIVARQAVVKVAPEALEYIVAPPGTPDGAKCLVVRGASFPPYKDGTAFVFWAFATDPAAFLGELCFVRLVSGEEYVREIGRGSRPHTWTLTGSMGEAALRDVAIDEVALIEIIVRRPQWTTAP